MRFFFHVCKNKEMAHNVDKDALWHAYTKETRDWWFESR